MNHKIVPIPETMKDLSIDKRGFPIPYVVLVDRSGVPHFKINDETKVEICLAERRCHICGNKIPDGESWWVGGTLSAFHPHGAFVDGGVHKECGEYALQVCPYMAYTQYQAKEIDTSKIAAEGRPMAYVNPTQTQERLDFFCFVNAESFEVVRHSPIHRFIHPKKPYTAIEFWLDGEQIKFAEAMQILWRKKKNLEFGLIELYLLTHTNIKHFH